MENRLKNLCENNFGSEKLKQQVREISYYLKIISPNKETRKAGSLCQIKDQVALGFWELSRVLTKAGSPASHIKVP